MVLRKCVLKPVAISPVSALDIEENKDINEMLARVENRVNGILNFPENLERPNVSRFEYQGWVSGVAVSGPLNDYDRKIIGQEIHDELLALPSIKQAILWGVDDYEIAIEVKEERLRELSMTLNEVAQMLRQSSVDLPAGMIRSSEGNILVRTQGKAYTGEDFERMFCAVILMAPNYWFLMWRWSKMEPVETSTLVNFDREPAINIGIFSLEDQNVLEIDQAVKEYIEKKRPALAEGLSIDQFAPVAPHLRGRLDMMMSNLAMGAVLVAIVLTLFLNIQVAFWVLLGIPVSFLVPFG